MGDKFEEEIDSIIQKSKEISPNNSQEEVYDLLYNIRNIVEKIKEEESKEKPIKESEIISLDDKFDISNLLKSTKNLVLRIKEGINIKPTIEKTTKIKSCSPIMYQMITSKLGAYCSERLSIDFYYLTEAIYLLIEELGEDYCKSKIPKFDELFLELEDVSEKVARAKIYYDSLNDTSKLLNPVPKSKKTDSVQRIIKKEFIKNSSTIPLIQKDIYKLFVSLIKLSSIQSQTINREYFKILENRSKPGFDATRKDVPGGK
jgi:hypothetical protein